MAELGISDVSDVSDPNLSEDDSPVARFKQAVSKKAVNKQSDEESDWDSTQVSLVVYIVCYSLCIPGTCTV